MIKSITELINKANLGLVADVGYSGEDTEGIFLLDTNTKGISIHTREDSIQIIIQAIKPYLEVKELVEQVLRILKEKTEAYNVNAMYVGSHKEKQTFTINLKIGGIN